MFERSFLDRPGDAIVRPWAVMVSFAGQIALVVVAVLLPLIYNEVIPAGRVLSIFLAPGPPPGRPKPQPAAKVKFAKAPERQNVSRGFVEPTGVPRKVAMIIEEPAAPPSGNSGDGLGVVGSIGQADAPLSRAVARILTDVPAVAPPEPPRTPEAKPLPAIRRITVGGQVQAAKLIDRAIPVYPVLARQARISGVVKLAAVIGVDGAIRDLRLVSGHPLLVPAAMAAVRQWRYQPTTLNGDPVEVDTVIDVNFTFN